MSELEKWASCYVQSLSWAGSGRVQERLEDGRVRVVCADGERRVFPADAVLVARRSSPIEALGSAPLEHVAEGVPVPKDPPVRSPDHLAWIRRRHCAVCGAAPPSQASHHPERGHGSTGAKCSDLRAIPLCAACHAAHHRAPLDREWVEERIAALLIEWVRTVGSNER